MLSPRIDSPSPSGKPTNAIVVVARKKRKKDKKKKANKKKKKKKKKREAEEGATDSSANASAHSEQVGQLDVTGRECRDGIGGCGEEYVLCVFGGGSLRLQPGRPGGNETKSIVQADQ